MLLCGGMGVTPLACMPIESDAFLGPETEVDDYSMGLGLGQSKGYREGADRWTQC